MLNKFVAYQNGREVVRALRPVIEFAKGRSTEIAKQLERASVSLQNNLAEGSGRTGMDRRRLFRYAEGSLREIFGALETMEDLGWPVDMTVLRPLLDRQGKLVWGLTHERRRAPAH